MVSFGEFWSNTFLIPLSTLIIMCLNLQGSHWKYVPYWCSCFGQTWNRKNATVPKFRKFCILKYGKSDLFCGNQILFLASQACSDLFQLAATWTEYEIHIFRANGRGGKYYKYFSSLCKLLPGEFWKVFNAAWAEYVTRIFESNGKTGENPCYLYCLAWNF